MDEEIRDDGVLSDETDIPEEEDVEGDEEDRI